MDIDLTKKHILFILLITLFSYVSLITSFNGHEGKVVFCDVGQGDGAYIRVYGNIDILVDVGPNDKILNCLGKHMPFYDKTIEIVFISHPQKDHYGGLRYIENRYKIRTIILSYTFPLPQDLLNNLELSKDLNVEYLFAGDEINIGSYIFTFLWPDKDFLSKTNQFIDPNEFSQIILARHDDKNILFTGDISGNYLDRVIKKCGCKIDVLKVPHHGSKTGLDTNFFTLADPSYSMISVGKNNRYRHPNEQVINMLEKSGTIIKRTDQGGDIEVIF